jgi:rhodanese-related sulfurtransferase
MATPSEEECRRQYEFYHRLFPDVPTMTSLELQERRRREVDEEDDNDDDASNNNNNLIVLVDVRTRPERQVSMIPGAIALQDYLQGVGDPSQTTATTTTTTPTPMLVVTYCTIGYRSGMEARRLRDLYPSLEGRIFHLDGVLAYTHTGQHLERQQHSSNRENIMGQSTTTPTRRVHTFGRMWKACANPECETELYGFPSILGRLAQVGGLVVVRTTQHAAHILLYSACCCCPRRVAKMH